MEGKFIGKTLGVDVEIENIMEEFIYFIIR